jgi:hypothetical protein
MFNNHEATPVAVPAAAKLRNFFRDKRIGSAVLNSIDIKRHKTFQILFDIPDGCGGGDDDDDDADADSDADADADADDDDDDDDASFCAFASSSSSSSHTVHTT